MLGEAAHHIHPAVCTSQGSKPLSKKSLGELEGDFLEALRVWITSFYMSCMMRIYTTHTPTQSFYYDGKPIMSNEEFDLLKEELTWQGSKVAVLRFVAVAVYCQQKHARCQ